MENFGEKIRRLREDKGIYLRQVASFLEIDQALLSKIERGERKAKREQVIKLAKFYNSDKDEFLTSWLSDKIASDLNSEKNAIDILKVAEEKIQYKRST
ncbi:MAG: helix-turn-helix domain-containing protein [Bacteroidales bacterium]|nr:helix-turn-helix domain-containing protein [Bacteroidales bacterium]MCF8338397.1 helix-turn-helix domain-containing protein [Bacteroidales bacterium]